MTEQKYHQSVLFDEVLEALNIVPEGTYLDCTLGGGGHTEGILRLADKVIALDIDEDAIENAKERFQLTELNGVWVTKDGSLKIIKENFQNLDQALTKAEVSVVSGVLFDLGVSSYMLDKPERGFSFSKPGPLDMRMSQDLAVSAADLVNGLNEGELYELLSKLGEVGNARFIARNIVRNRLERKIETTQDLARVVSGGKVRRKGEIDPATTVFMALRIAVNDELNNLKTALPKAVSSLKKGGRLVVLSFHSLEDRIVKDFMKSSPELKILSDKPIVATDEEIGKNRRARSVKMRIAERI